MREIEFKAKKINSDEWVQGCYCNPAGRLFNTNLI